MMSPAPSITPESGTTSQPDASVNCMVTEALDQQLLHYSRHNQPFTISEIRDHLLKLPELASMNHVKLRYRVRDRLNTLERDGLAERVGLLGKRRVIYQVALEDTDDESECSPVSPSSTHSSSESSDALADYLSNERDRLRAEMQTALGEAEHYRSLLNHFPAERGRIAPLLETAIERGSRLKGQWDANTTVRSMLNSEGANT
ncbi:hypothetical protein [Halomonas chromatireducens]|uniref:Transcriptional regulator VspR n=1 Tax=Halomonas chromatireducens TaxID=507626 RepID=A0A109UM82_9GAMM|nr:hypothetical protein [Halomonas chromatireducens]AMD01542.1 hypothetical protein LOKO_02482 [Halomonas chromatireducens]